MPRTIKSSDLDKNFKFEVANTREGKTVLGCIQCGICSSSCPFSEDLKVKPHELIRMILHGMREEALSSKKIWVCTTCYMCAERCPHAVETGNVMMALANIAAKEKGVPNELRKIGKTLLSEGRVLKISRMRLKERKRLELPNIPDPNTDDITKLLEEIGVKDLVTKEENS
jgi:heterodisulfide reductase subunit C